MGQGASTVKQVNEAMNKDRATGYTTTLKLMQIMAEKGLVIRDESHFSISINPRSARKKLRSSL